MTRLRERHAPLVSKISGGVNLHDDETTELNGLSTQIETE